MYIIKNYKTIIIINHKLRERKFYKEICIEILSRTFLALSSRAIRNFFSTHVRYSNSISIYHYYANV